MLRQFLDLAEQTGLGEPWLQPHCCRDKGRLAH